MPGVIRHGGFDTSGYAIAEKVLHGLSQQHSHSRKLNNDKIRMGERQVHAQQCDLHARTGAATVRVVSYCAGCCVIDNITIVIVRRVFLPLPPLKVSLPAPSNKMSLPAPPSI